MNTIDGLLTPVESQQSGMSTLTITEAETRAYIKGDTLVAALLARIEELEEQIERGEDVK